MQDHFNCKDRVQRALSDHSLPKQQSVTTSSNKYESRINYTVVGSNGFSGSIADHGTDLKQLSWKYHIGQVFYFFKTCKTLLKPFQIL